MSKSRIIQIVGLSKSGKTSLILELIKQLTESQYSVSVIKSARDYKIQQSMKDSDRFVGTNTLSSTVVFSNLIQISLKENLPLKDIISSIKKLNEQDIILVEGFKAEKYDKIIIWSKDLEENIDLFNLTNLQLLYCQEMIYKQNKNDIEKFAQKYSVKILSNISDIISFIIGN